MSGPPTDLDRQTAVVRMQELAARLGRRPKRKEFCAATGISRVAFTRQFGSYGGLVAAAGLAPHTPRLDDAVLVRALRDGLLQAGGIVGFWRVMQHGVHAHAIRSRWLGWGNALVVLRDWLEAHEPQFPHLEALRRHCAAGRTAPGAAEPAASLRPCGELIRFRALDHAPTSESAVVFLFGAVAEELGFVVEALNVAFPDAEGRRRVGRTWRRVRIEFEHRSRNFLAHGHDAAGCDLIVCWEHNWPECPVEVLELKSEIKRLLEKERT